MWLAAIGFAVCALALLSRAFRDHLARRRLWRRMERARQAERAAPGWLAEHGYAIVASQVTSSYELSIDGKPVPIRVRADLLVERAGRRFIAEVKSGALAPNIATRATRRQLLEYRLAFDVDGVLLVDAERECAQLVCFPDELRERSWRGGGWLCALALFVWLLWSHAR
jgi:hypothetical protein